MRHAQKVAHLGAPGNADCDTWAEKETMARAWKNNFPAECQEFISTMGNPGKSTSLMFVRLMAL